MAEAKILSCLLCPRGCRLELLVEGGLVTVSGNACPRGETYGRQEAIAPMRSLTSTVRAEGGARARLAVRTSGDIPLARMLEAVYALDDIVVSAPVAAGERIRADFLGMGVDLLAGDELKALPGPGYPEAGASPAPDSGNGEGARPPAGAGARAQGANAPDAGSNA
jgi:CxxC motif-containing protein